MSYTPTQVAQAVWDATTRRLLAPDASVAEPTSDAALMAQAVWTNDERTLYDPLVLDDDETLEIESPFVADKVVDTVAATGGTTPISYSITSQDLPAGQRFAITGDPDPDCRTDDTGAPAGTYNGEPYWSWEAGGETWYLWWLTSAWWISAAVGDAGTSWLGGGEIQGDYGDFNATTGTATVAHLTPFKIGSSTGTIAIDDPTGLEVGQEWEVVVRATDAASETDDGTMTVTTVGVTPDPIPSPSPSPEFPTLYPININKTFSFRQNTKPIFGALASRR
jgi:hypothetical protein